LMVRREFAESCSAEHLALVAALLEACEWCDTPENREQVIATLARPEYVGVPAAALRHAFDGRIDFGHGRVRSVPGFNLFFRHAANEPSGAKAAWVLQHLRQSGPGRANPALNAALGREVFRLDLFEKARALRHASDSEPENEHEIKSENELAIA
jgi:hypothetical protein